MMPFFNLSYFFYHNSVSPSLFRYDKAFFRSVSICFYGINHFADLAKEFCLIHVFFSAFILWVVLRNVLHATVMWCKSVACDMFVLHKIWLLEGIGHIHTEIQYQRTNYLHGELSRTILKGFSCLQDSVSMAWGL